MEKIVMVTGAAGVLGSAISLAFGKAGHKVVLSDIKVKGRGEEITEQINRGPGQAFFLPVDVRNYDQVTGMVDETLKRWGRVDVLAYVAGQSLGRLTGTGQEKLLIEQSDEEWDLVVDSILKGAFHCIKAVAAPMMTARNGHIIIMASGTGLSGRPGVSSYAAAKAGQFGLMKTAAQELGSYNIRVNAVNPGRILHPGDVILPAERVIADSVLKRIQEAEEIADFFVYLSGMENVSGQILNMTSLILF